MQPKQRQSRLVMAEDIVPWPERIYFRDELPGGGIPHHGRTGLYTFLEDAANSSRMLYNRKGMGVRTY